MKRSNGEGTIYKRSDGRWCGAYYDDAPTPRRHFVYGKTQSEVKKKLKEMKENPVQAQKRNTGYTLGEWVEFYLNNYKKNEVKQTTFDSYMGIYRKHIKTAAISKIKLKKLTCDELQKYYNGKSAENYNAKTVKHIHILINSALKKAQQLKYINENVNEMVILPKKKTFQGNALSACEVNRIFTEAKDDDLYPIIVLTICTGLRKGEVMALKWSNINFEARELYVEGSLCKVAVGTDERGKLIYENRILEPKTEKSHRTVPLLEQALEVLRIQKERQNIWKEKYKDIYVDEDFVFTEVDGSIIRQRSFMDHYHAFLYKYDITNIRFHDLRHTFASLLLEAGESPKVIQELLGHSTITTTMDTYAHVTDKSKIRAVRTLDTLLGEASDENN